MAEFKVHFFKERSRMIDVDEVINYFKKHNYTVTMNERYLKFTYEHPTILASFYFMLTPKSTVPDIYRLSPKYLDVNFEFNMPILVSNFMLDLALKAIESFSKYFGLASYHPLFEDVLPFHYETLHEVYKLYKKAYLRQNPSYLESYIFMDKEQLYFMSKYTDDIHSLKEYFKDINVFVPKYQFLLCQDTLYIGFEWKDDVLTVIPPSCNVFFYREAETLHMISMNLLSPILDKYFSKVPGTILGTRVLIAKYSKKVTKFIKKLPHISLCDDPKKVTFDMLMPKE